MNYFTAQIKPWHILCVLGLATQLYIFRQYELGCKCRQAYAAAGLQYSSSGVTSQQQQQQGQGSYGSGVASQQQRGGDANGDSYGWQGDGRGGEIPHHGQLETSWQHGQDSKISQDYQQQQQQQQLEQEERKNKQEQAGQLVNQGEPRQQQRNEHKASKMEPYPQAFAGMDESQLHLVAHDTCKLEKVGGRGGDDYGAWSLCTNHVRPGGVVYSFGIGADVSFDNGMVNRGHKVFGFDPTVPPERVQAMFKDHHNRDQPSAFQFRQLGLAGTDGIVTFFHSKNPRVQSMTAVKPEKLSGRFEAQGMPAPVLRLPTFMCGNGHGFVDVLKMDVEGVEFDVCDAWLRMRSPLPFGQILIEFHDRMVTDAKARKGACLRALARNGFVEVYVSENFQEATYARMAKKGRDDTMA
ncbi:hypothetical protein CLOM_g12079 [Closterium sp. NIES-68]|nr:hypothetical protein CLOM_g12079 [Closterium sp. NIES-68]